jgi:hypothetical protein
MRADLHQTARRHPCPKCGAQPGHPCVNTATGKPFQLAVHRERIREEPDD